MTESEPRPTLRIKYVSKAIARALANVLLGFDERGLLTNTWQLVDSVLAEGAVEGFDLIEPSLATRALLKDMEAGGLTDCTIVEVDGLLCIKYGSATVEGPFLIDGEPTILVRDGKVAGE